MQHPIEHYFKMVDDVLTEYGIDPESSRSTRNGQWNLKVGSAKIFVDVYQSKDDQGNLTQYGYFQVVSPVCEVPVNNQHLFTKELLEANHSLYGVAFTIYKETAYLKAIRELEALDNSEIRNTLNRVGRYADDWDDRLKARYFSFIDGGRG